MAASERRQQRKLALRDLPAGERQHDLRRDRRDEVLGQHDGEEADVAGRADEVGDGGDAPPGTLAEWLSIPRSRSSTRPRRRRTPRSATARSPRMPRGCCPPAAACSTSAARRAGCWRCCAPAPGTSPASSCRPAPRSAAAQVADHVVQGALEDPDLPFERGLLRPRRARRRARAPRRSGGGPRAGDALVPARRRGPRQRPERRALAGAADAAARALAADRQRHVRRQPPALVHARLARRRCSRGAGLRDVELHAIVPALRNHAPAAAAPSRAAWSRPGRRSGAARRGCSATRSIGVGPARERATPAT